MPSSIPIEYQSSLNRSKDKTKTGTNTPSWTGSNGNEALISQFLDLSED